MKSELQFLQKIDLVEKKTYRFTVWLRALEPAMLNIAFCQAGSPFTTYQRKIVSMTTQWQPSSVTATAPKTQRGYMMVATDKENVTL